MKNGASIAILASLTLAVGCGSDPKPSPDFPAASYTGQGPSTLAYRLAPGDQIEVIVHTAPELSRTVTITPDGRAQLTLGQPVLAAGLTTEELRDAFRAALSGELRDPRVTVVATGFSSQKIFVGGQVANSGMFDLPGQIDPLQAIIMAGGFTDRSRTRQVLLMRRMPDGEVRTAVFDIRAGIFDPQLAAWAPPQRFDVAYVPTTKIAEENLFVQQFIRQALPLEFQFFYDVSGQQDR